MGQVSKQVISSVMGWLVERIGQERETEGRTFLLK